MSSLLLRRSSSFGGRALQEKLHVFASTKPLSEGEDEDYVSVRTSSCSVEVAVPAKGATPPRFTLDGCFDSALADPDEMNSLFHASCIPLINAASEGKSSCLLLHGPLASGKSATLFGMEGGAGEGLFSKVCRALLERRSDVKFSIFQLYTGNVLGDLLDPKLRLKIRCCEDGSFYVQGLQPIICTSFEEVQQALNTARKHQHILATAAATPYRNSLATTFVEIRIPCAIQATSRRRSKGHLKTFSRLLLVDLPASGKIPPTANQAAVRGAVTSLTAMTTALELLARMYRRGAEQTLIPQLRDSPLTKLLMPCFLGPNAGTISLVVCLPLFGDGDLEDVDFGHTLLTVLRFADRLKLYPPSSDGLDSGTEFGSQVIAAAERLKNQPPKKAPAYVVATLARARWAKIHAAFTKEEAAQRLVLVFMERAERINLSRWTVQFALQESKRRQSEAFAKRRIAVNRKSEFARVFGGIEEPLPSLEYQYPTPPSITQVSKAPRRQILPQIGGPKKDGGGSTPRKPVPPPTKVQPAPPPLPVKVDDSGNYDEEEKEEEEEEEEEEEDEKKVTDEQYDVVSINESRHSTDKPAAAPVVKAKPVEPPSPSKPSPGAKEKPKLPREEEASPAPEPPKKTKVLPAAAPPTVVKKPVVKTVTVSQTVHHASPKKVPKAEKKKKLEKKASPIPSPKTVGSPKSSFSKLEKRKSFRLAQEECENEEAIDRKSISDAEKKATSSLTIQFAKLQIATKVAKLDEERRKSVAEEERRKSVAEEERRKSLEEEEERKKSMISVETEGDSDTEDEKNKKASPLPPKKAEGKKAAPKIAAAKVAKTTTAPAPKPAPVKKKQVAEAPKPKPKPKPKAGKLPAAIPVEENRTAVAHIPTPPAASRPTTGSRGSRRSAGSSVPRSPTPPKSPRSATPVKSPTPRSGSPYSRSHSPYSRSGSHHSYSHSRTPSRSRSPTPVTQQQPGAPHTPNSRDITPHSSRATSPVQEEDIAEDVPSCMTPVEEKPPKPNAAEVNKWVAMCQTLPTDRSDESRERRRKLFDQFDPNGNGYLSLAEVDKGIRDVLQLVEIFEMKPVIMRAFQAAKNSKSRKDKPGTHGADYVEKSEFRLLLVYLRQYFELWKMFSIVDTTGDRQIDFGEFRVAIDKIEKWGVFIADPDAEFNQIDKNGGGMILFDEFAEWALKKRLDLEDDDDFDFDAATQKQTEEPVEEIPSCMTPDVMISNNVEEKQTEETPIGENDVDEDVPTCETPVEERVAREMSRWVAMSQTLPTDRSDESRERRRTLFDQFDPNGNGYLSLAEVDKGIRDVLQLTEVFDAKPVIMRAFQAAKNSKSRKDKPGTHGADYVEKSEFRLLLVYLRQYFELWKMFSIVDRSCDRRVDLAEFSSALGKIANWGVTVDDVEGEFKAIDKNGGGMILFDEFAEWALKKRLDLEDDDDFDFDAAMQKQTEEPVEEIPSSITPLEEKQTEAIPSSTTPVEEKQAEETEVPVTDGTPQPYVEEQPSKGDEERQATPVAEEEAAADEKPQQEEVTADEKPQQEEEYDPFQSNSADLGGSPQPPPSLPPQQGMADVPEFLGAATAHEEQEQEQMQQSGDGAAANNSVQSPQDIPEWLANAEPLEGVVPRSPATGEGFTTSGSEQTNAATTTGEYKDDFE